jgi:hypothetical protein
MNTVDILKNFIIEFENECRPSITFDEDTGYTSNFRYYGKESFAKRIGAELIKNNIPFSSLYDIGYGKFDSTPYNPDPEAENKYTESCKKTPNHIFLQKILPSIEQKAVLLKVLDKLDLSLCYYNPLGVDRIYHDNFDKLNSVFHLLDDLKNIGLDKVNINAEITSIVKNGYINGEISNPNIAMSFINSDFSFDKEFVENHFKKSFFTHFVSSHEPAYDNLCCINEQNRIKFNYNDINNSLPINDDKVIKKNKI